jgi:hypothetical protein
MEKQPKQPEQPDQEALAAAIKFALENRGYKPGESPLQTRMVTDAISAFVQANTYDSSGVAPIQELGVLAFCKLTGTKMPKNRDLRWPWKLDPDSWQHLDSLEPLQNPDTTK